MFINGQNFVQHFQEKTNSIRTGITTILGAVFLDTRPSPIYAHYSISTAVKYRKLAFCWQSFRFAPEILCRVCTRCKLILIITVFSSLLCIYCGIAIWSVYFWLILFNFLHLLSNIVRKSETPVEKKAVAIWFNENQFEWHLMDEKIFQAVQNLCAPTTLRICGADMEGKNTQKLWFILRNKKWLNAFSVDWWCGSGRVKR